MFRRIAYPLRRYGVAVLAVLVALAVKLLLDPLIPIESPFLLFFAAVMASALYGGLWPGVLATVLSALLGDCFFLSPTHSLLSPHLGQNVRLGLFVLEGLLISNIIAALSAAKRRSQLNQEALRQSEERYRLLVGAVRDCAIFTLDPEGYVTSWNLAAQGINGYAAGEILGKHFSCFYPQEDIDLGKPFERLKVTATEGHSSEEGWRVRKDGSRFWASAEIAALRDEAGNLQGFSKIIRDLSQAKRAQEEIIGRNLNGIIEGSNNLIAALDRDFRFIAFNSAYKQEFEKIFGKPIERGMSLADTLTHLPEERAKALDIWNRALRGEEFTVIEEFGSEGLERNCYEITYSSIFDENSQLIGAAHIARDVSERVRAQAEKSRLNEELEQRVRERTLELEAANRRLEEEIRVRAQAEAALRESERRFRVAIDSMPNPFVIYDAQRRLQFVNAEGIQRSGLPLEALVGHTDEELFPPEVTETYLPALKQAVATRSVRTVESTSTLPAAGTHTAIVTYVPLLNERGEIYQILGITYDISDRKQFEESLREKTRQITNIFESMADGVVSLDPQWRYTYVNSKAEQLLGKPRSQLIGSNMWEVFPELLDSPTCAHCQKAVTERVTVEYEEFYPRFGKWFAVRLYPCAEGLSIYFLDITGRKQAESALRLSESKYRRLVESNVFGVITAGSSGEITEANDAFLQMIGCTREDLLTGKINWRSLTPPEHLPQDERIWQEIKLSGAFAPFEKEYIRFDGSRVPILAAGALLEGTQETTVCIVVDLTERKRAEEERTRLIRQLEKERAQLEATVQSIPDAVYIGDRTGIWKCNELAFKILGFDSAEDLKQNLAGLVERIQTRYPDTGERVPVEDLVFVRALQGTATVREVLVRQVKSGRDIALRSAAAPIWCNGEIIGAIAINTDITNQKQVERMLRESEERFRTVAEAMPQIVWTAQPDGSVDYYNQRWAEYSGISQKNGCGWGWQPVLHPEDEQPTVEAWTQAVQTGQIYECEHRVRKADGSFRWHLSRGVPLLDREGQIVKWFGTATDIHDQKLAERALRESKERLSAALAASETGTFRWDIRTGTVDWDENLHRLFGLPPGKTVCRIEEFLERVHPEDREEVSRRCQLCALEGGDRDLEFRALWPDGSVRWLSEKGKTFFDDEGKPLYMTGACADITERKRAEAEREVLLESERAARAEAEMANRMKDEFLATLSHELRTPLTSIIGWASLLRSQKFDEKSAAHALEKIERNGKSLAQLIEDILDVSRIIRGKINLELAEVELSEVIEAAIDTVRPVAEAKDVCIKAQLDFCMGRVRGDASRLQQVVWNLLSNAVKFTPSGGRVEVRLSAEMRDGELGIGDGELGIEQNNQSPIQNPKSKIQNPKSSHSQFLAQSAHIQVSDTGIGIAAEFLPFVFERFRQADSTSTRSHGGLGLGLAIVRHLVELHGGTVAAQSPGVGQGATFSVKLPVLPPTRGTLSRGSCGGQESLDDSSDSLAGVRVLVVDDRADTCDLLAAILELYGAEVTPAASASEALRVLELFNPDVVVSDISMPGEDGYTLMRKIRALPARRGGRIPAVALTAYARTEDRMQALQAGFQIHVPKPVNPDELAVVVAQLAGRTLKI
ncbi:PAS domain S-box protein [Kamptonema formosum]|uniref:PAS domain S-box protein n=1 Tax=Kamptonema formosum TaxID=331992 RepID=UPI000344F986|nr:PAS domain S-box protein [Oscillatoria sp. PCC 10802]